MYFSIIVPTYNSANYITKLYNTLSQQTYTKFEVLFVDDCSTDNTPSICRYITQQDDRFKFFRLQEHKGPGAARNLGLSYAQGTYIIFIDSDDFISLNYLQQLYNTIQQTNKTNDNYFIVNKRINTEYNTFNVTTPDVEYNNNIQPISVYNIPTSVCRTVFCKPIIDNFNIKFNEKILHFEDALFVNQYISYTDPKHILQFNGIYVHLDRDDSITHDIQINENNKRKIKALNYIQKYYDNLIQYNNKYHDVPTIAIEQAKYLLDKTQRVKDKEIGKKIKDKKKKEKKKHV